MLLISYLQVCHCAYTVVLRPFKSVQNNVNEVINECCYTFFVCAFVYCNSRERWGSGLTAIYLYCITGNIMALTAVSLCCLGMILAKK